MAGERKGKVYEALTVIALEETRWAKDQSVFWNEIPQGITIEPDITVGLTKDSPNTILLLTHSGSSKKSGMKFWRNIGELAEVKTRLKIPPKVLSIAFDPVIYPDLRDIQAASFDGQLVVGERQYGKQMQEFVEQAAAASYPSGQEKQKHFLRSLLGTEERGNFFIAFTNDVDKLMSASNPEMDELWGLERYRDLKDTRDAKVTHFRRGFSKLLVFNNVDHAIDLFLGRKVRNFCVPESAYQLGLLSKSLAGPKPKDLEISALVHLLSREQIHDVLKHAPLDDMADWLHQLRYGEHLSIIGEYVKNNIDSIKNPKRLLQEVKRLHQDPNALLTSSIPGWPPKSVWLLEYLIELVKISTGRANGYGHAQLGRDVVKAGFGNEKDLRNAGQFGGGIGLPAWIRRNPTPFREDLVEGICTVLSQRLNALGDAVIKDLAASASEKVLRNTLETKVLTYYKFDPIWTLIRQVLPEIRQINFRACFSERAQLSRLAGVSQVAQVKSTVINWQSATDAGRDHKRKELCGRAVAIRYKWDSERNKFVTRPHVRKLILILDGTWRKDDLDALIHAGWDEIFYPDEMDKLERAIA